MTLIEHLAGQMADLRKAGTFKEELVLESPQGPRVKVKGREVVMLTSNNYLGFANHPRVREAQKKAVDRWGAGLGSVRFICGTQQLHKELEAEISAFFGTDDTILYMTCWAANEGLFAAILDEADGLYSDELNHASIIDGVRLSKARRFRVPHKDTGAFAKMVAEDGDSRFKLMITDGVFSMEGELADLPELVRICETHGVDPRRGRLPRHRDPRQERPRHRRGAGRLRPHPDHDRYARQGHGIGRRRLRDGAEGRRRDAATEEPHLSLFQLAAARGRGRCARDISDAPRGPGARREAARQCGVLSQGDLRGRIPDPPRHSPDRPGHRRRHREGARHGQGPLRGRRLRFRVRVPGRAAGPGAPALPGLGSARTRRPRPGRGRVQEGGEIASASFDGR